jgi:hypothetical protein
MSRKLKTHPYRGMRLTAAELKRLPECLSELTEDHIRVRLAQGMASEVAVTLPLKDRTQRSEAAALKILSAKNLEEARLIKIMAVPVKPASTSAYYAIGAIEARKQLALVNNELR